MRAKQDAGKAKWVDPDDASELTAAMLATAEVFEGNRSVRRGPGRPKAAVTKEQINVRLDPDVLARLRESGPGWQSQINAILRKALSLNTPPGPPLGKAMNVLTADRPVRTNARRVG